MICGVVLCRDRLSRCGGMLCYVVWLCVVLGCVVTCRAVLCCGVMQYTMSCCDAL